MNLASMFANVCGSSIRIGICAAIACTVGVSLIEVSSAQIPNDFDGDGLSDLLLTSPTTASIKWQSIPSTTGGTSINTEFGRANDSTIPGYWLGSTTPSLAVVTTDTSANRLTWRAIQADGTVTKRALGIPGDYVVSGADFNGDGLADAAVMRLTGSRFRWSVAYSLLADPASSVKVRKFTFGTAGDRLLYFNLDGTKDLVGVFGLRRGRHVAELTLRDVTTRKQQRFGRFPRRLALGQRPRPLPVKRADGSDVLAFVTTDATDTTIEVYDISGNLLDKAVLPGLGPIFVGDFDDSLPGQEIGLQSGSSVRYVNPFEQTRNAGPTGINGTSTSPYQIFLTVAPTPTATPVPEATETPT